MVFSSIGFIYLFLPAVLLLHTLLPRRLKNPLLLLASLLFYYVGEQGLTVVMLLSAAADFLCSLGIEKHRENRVLTRLFLGISLTFNIGLLVYFKYADLLVGSFNLLTGSAVPLLRTALPIGISFYTFQTMSYTVDVYRGRIGAEKKFLDFAAYVTLFPQLVAGPIVRYETVSAELRERKVTVGTFAAGIRRFCLGLAKKVLLANTLAEFTALYADTQTHTLLFAWGCALADPMQIYFDFSGYSDMAIGLGGMLGFTFPENFDYPFISRTATEFWRRWHMTLGSWFRDYLYIPMGGNRVRVPRQILNLLTVWAVTGLWHGASYNFILWGLWYGLLLIGEKFVYGKLLEKTKVLSRVYFILITVVGFEIFSASGTADVFRRIGELFGVGISGLTDTASAYYLRSWLCVIVLSVVLSMPLPRRAAEKLRSSHPSAELVLAAAESVFSLLLLIVSTGYLVDGSYNPFLYFRF